MFDRYCAEWGARPFSWAAANCCSFAAGWVAVATGRHPMHGLGPTRNALEARRLVAALGGTLEQAWTRQLGRPPIAPALAQLGDVVLRAMPQGDGVGHAAGVCNGRTAAFAAEEGLLHVPLAECTHAWRLQA